jgi:hypothetical protein
MSDVDRHDFGASLSRRRVMKVMLGAAAAGVAGDAAAVVTEAGGFRFEPSIRLGGEDLLLNGVGVRTRFFIPVYVAALYVPTRSSDAETLLSQRGPRRMALRFVRDVEAELFMTSLDAGMRKHYTDQQLDAWKEQWQTLTKVIGTMVQARRADHVSWDYTPEEGARVMQNSVARVPSMRGEAFYNAVLRVWLGPHPADEGLKKGVLGL